MTYAIGYWPILILRFEGPLLSELLLLLRDKLVHSVQVVVLVLPEFLECSAGFFGNNAADCDSYRIFLNRFVSLLANIIFETLTLCSKFIDRGLILLCSLRVVLCFHRILVRLRSLRG